MPALTQDQKVFIVTRLACYDTPRMILDAWKEAFPGIEPPKRAQISGYDLDCVAGQRMAKELQQLFKATRKSLQKDWAKIPIAQKGYRLRALDTMARGAMEKKNMAMAASLLEQAAKEAGEAFTNRHHVNLKGKLDVATISDQQLVEALAKFGVQAVLPNTIPAGAAPSDEDKTGEPRVH